MLTHNDLTSDTTAKATRYLSCVHLADVLVTGVILLTSALTFTCNDLFAYLSANLSFIPGGVYLLIVCAAAGSVLLGRFLGTGTGNVVCLGWLLYVPSVLNFSRLDLLSIIVPGGFSAFSSSLPASLVIIAGVVLTGCTLAHGSLAELKVLRSGFIGRGAEPAEVDTAMRKNMRPVAVVLATALLLSMIVAGIAMIIVPFIASNEYAGTLHLLFLATGTILFAFLTVAYLWSKRSG